MAPALLSDAEIHEALERLDGWEHGDGRLRRRFQFDDFVGAFGFMTRVALVAERMDHHPDWSNSWNTVDIAIMSHAAGGVTAQCVELAAAIDRLS